MSDFVASISEKKQWRTSFLEQVDVTNTGSGTLTDVSLEITTTAELIRSWGGAYTDLGDGRYLLEFDDVSIAPGETATMTFKAKGENDVALVTSPDPEPEPEPQPEPGPTTITVAPGATAAEIQALIDGAEEGTIIELQEGLYQFEATVLLNRDGVSVVGAGSGLTVIDASGLTQEAFAVGDGTMSGSFTLAADAAEGATSIDLSGPHSLVAGDYVYLERESTEAFYDEIGDETWRNTDVPLRTSILEVLAVDGNSITLSGGLHFDFTVAETTVREIDMVEGVTLGGFSVEYGLGAADPSLFENTLAEFDRDAVIQVEGTAGLSIYDITAHDVPSLGLNFALSTGVAADDIEITGAHNKGGGGNGYAVQIRDVYDSSFTNLTDQDMRHSVVFASWRSAAGNLVHVASTDRDINFHGGRDHDNVVYVDRSVRDASSDIISPTLFVNTEGTSYGSVTDADANTAKFGYVVGTRLADRVEGYDAGSWLDGQGGSDTLIGGAGNDVLIGGDAGDLLQGGDGEDIAVLDQSRFAYAVSAENGVVTVRHLAQPAAADTLTGVEWLLFADAALRLDDMTLTSRTSLDGVFAGVSAYDPATGTLVSAPGPVLDTAAPAGGEIFGTEGKDVIDVTELGTVVWGLGGWDVVRSTVDFVMSDDVEKLELLGTGPVNGQGGGNDNILTGTGASNVLLGMGGDDRIWARSGDDYVDGGAGADELYGGGGNDIIAGGAGADILTGDSGADTFCFHTLSDSSAGEADLITDFLSGTDLIDLSAIDADTGTAGDQAFVFGGSGAGALWLDAGSLFGDVDGDGVADLRIDIGGAALSASDIIL